jgi:glycosyltransferase involved in cell wall biosynthesis
MLPMTLVLTLESRFQRTPDGAVWSPYLTRGLWDRYLEVFDRLRILARIEETPSPPHDAHLVSGSRVAFQPVPHYHGPVAYLRHIWQVERAAREAVGPDDAVIMRIASQLAGHLEPRLRQRGHPYGVEVVGDPHDVFAPGVVDHPLRPALRWHFSRQVRRQCEGAVAAAYVTRQTLQRRYPPGPGTFGIGCSDVELDEDAFRRPRPTNGAGERRTQIVAVGSLDQLYKGPDVLLDALVTLTQNGLDLGLTWIGGGRFQAALAERVTACGLGDRVRFLGQVPAGEAVRAELDATDLFVLPSRTEGLPRALLEAMARGLPCVGTAVGGIPELLPAADLVPPGDPVALAAKLHEVVGDVGRMNQMAARNYETAREYRTSLLREHRLRFYRALRERTEQWIAERAGR